MNRHKMQINPPSYIGHGQYVEDCPTSNIQLKDEKAEILEAERIMCRHCVAICPKEVVTISGYNEAVVEQVSSVRLDPQKVLGMTHSRRTIRQFQETEIPAETISQILKAGRLAHTTGNKQDVIYIVIDREKASLEQQAVKFFRRLKSVADLFSFMARRTIIDNHFSFFQAPVAIAIAAEEEADGALVAQNMELIVKVSGLGVLYSGLFAMVVNYSQNLRTALHTSKGKKAVTTLVLGYPKIRYQRSVQWDTAGIRYMQGGTLMNKECQERITYITSDFHIREVAFTTIGGETRQAVLLILIQSERPGVRVNEIAGGAYLVRLSVSHHLQIPKEAGIVDMRKERTKNYYYIGAGDTQWKQVKQLIDLIYDSVIHLQREEEERYL